ncbi:S-adenosyl-L-methionine-dependent methyltransferase [Mycena alexandri]|uniref:S-adenosyl-L-methionine-dependent methyltransferase n=1 Tax=Mycena alexandri TaxID=1745969 RepID=A0AAD6TLP4_9AGAR|nr:S-adenosyl-L-methionine-dependent methyltransferase [Mycena alexandri]
MSSNAKEQLEALLALINDSARAAMAEYDKTGGIPSPYDLEPHPLDSAPDPIALKRSIRVLEGAVDQLRATLAPPAHTLLTRAQNYYWACLSVAQRARVAEILKDYPAGLDIVTLGERTRMAPGKLQSVLRMLAARSVFREVSPGVFANNRLSANMITELNIGDLVELYTVEAMAPTLTWYDSLVDAEYAHTYDNNKSAWAYSVKDTLKGTGGFFKYLQTQPARRKVFGSAMVGLSHATGSLAAISGYPWSKYKTVADVGSGIGEFAMKLARDFPVVVTLHDLPPTIKDAEKFWAEKYPEAIESNRVKFAPMDFFAGPPAPNMDIYFYRLIIHNWPDKEATLILKNAAAVMAPHSRIIIQDYVLQNPSPKRGLSEGQGVDLAPEPMMPNFGAGNIKHYAQDITMLIMYNGKERTLDEVVELGSQAGLKLDKVWDLADTSLIEFVLA